MSTTPSTDHLIAEALLAEKRRDRRWKTIRSFAWLLFFLLCLWLLLSGNNPSARQKKMANASYVSLVRLSGMIASQQAFSAEKVVPELNLAFHDPHAKGVILLVNSPGGSPVQAQLIHNRIIQLKHQTHKKVVVVAEDSLTSGAYLVATAADKIYVQPDTLTGSIGVIMSSFGFEGLIKKLGISRRVFTAGTNKNRLDPFKQLTSQDTQRIGVLLAEVHQHFINDVLVGRGNRLKGNRHTLFSGDFWTGETAVKLGLVDDTGDLWYTLSKEFKVSHYKDYTRKPGVLHRLLREAQVALDLPSIGASTQPGATLLSLPS
jgi:protease-4